MAASPSIVRGVQTLGILVSSADDKFENALIRGVSDAAIQAGANWICFTSGAIRSYHGFESQRNILYDLVNPEVVSGLIVSGTLGHGVSHDELREFCLGYQALPVATVAVKLDDIPCVVSDSYQGIRDLVDHLIDVHKRERIAFVRGPVGHQEADERFKAYLDSLLAHGFLKDDALNRVVIGDYTIGSGRKAMKDALDNKMPFDAVVGANDSMALGALQILESNGYKVPRDVALVGFDDTEDSRHSIPPLTTAQQLVYEMGWNAGRLMLAKLNGEETEAAIVVHPNLVIRESCGCSNQGIEKAAIAYNPSRIGNGDLYHAAFSAMKQVIPGHLQKRCEGQIKSVLKAFLNDMEDVNSRSFVESLQRAILYSFSIPDVDGYWGEIISALRKTVLENASVGFDISRAEMLWQQVRVLIGETVQKHEVNSRLHVEKRSVALREISEMLMSSRRLSDVLDVIVMELPRLGVRSCYLSLFDEVEKSLEWSRLILAYDTNGRIPLAQDGVRFLSRQLLPGNMLTATKSIGFVAEALYSKDARLGFMLLDVDAADSMVCGALRGLLSGALQGVILKEQREQAEEQLIHYQKNLEQLVEERTTELNKTNQQLEEEIAERERAKMEREALIDELEAKNAELEQFAYTVSHDLKSPLVTIKGFLGYLREDAISGNSQRLETDISRISEAADKMYALLSDLLELSRIGRMMNEPEDIPFIDLINEALQLTDGRLQEYGVEVIVEKELPIVVGDRQRLLEVVQNLLDNAAKFMGDQVRPKIEVGTAGVENKMPIFYIRDNGIGIAPEFHERIFGLFNRLNPHVDGTGIGLAVVKRIIEFHGGRIWVKSEAGKGAEFYFTVPTNEPKSG